MSNLPHIYYLSIAGFMIKVDFAKADIPYHRNRFLSEFQRYYKGFIMLNDPQRCDYQVSFLDQVVFYTLKNTAKGNLIFYSKDFPRKVVTHYAISMLQFQIIITDILCKLLAEHSGFILHASCLVQDGKASLFTGRSGIGKTTVIRFLKDKRQVISDDSIIIRKINGYYFVGPTSFMEKYSWITRNAKLYPLDKVILLRRGKKEYMSKIDDYAILLKNILNQTFTASGVKEKTAKNVSTFISHFHTFYFLSYFKKKESLTCFLHD